MRWRWQTCTRHGRAAICGQLGGYVATDLQVCTWDMVGEYCYWQTDCGKEFSIEDGTPKENGFKFCVYCGKKLRQRITRK